MTAFPADTAPRLRGAGGDDTLRAATRDDAEALRAALDDIGYTPPAVQEAVGEGYIARSPVDLTVHLRRLAGVEPRLTAAIELFAIGIAIPAEEAERALGGELVLRLLHAGLLERDGAGIASRAAILQTGDVRLTADWELPEPPTRHDHVMGLSSSTRVLARLAPRRPAGRVLDLCTGGGLQAILLARHAARVIGTDINPRALRFAAFSCWLNGIDNVELRPGNMLEAVAGEQFDLVVANPPYVISPENAYAFRDSGERGDAFCESLVRELPTYLADGGLACVLVSWTHGVDGDPVAPVRDWLATTGCDALVLKAPSLDPLTYAEGWNRARGLDAAGFARGLEEWLAYLHRLEMERITWGAVVLRRRRGQTWFHVHDIRAEEVRESGEHVLRLIAAKDLLARLAADSDLLASRLAPAGEHVVEQTGRISGGRLEIGRVVLRPPDGLRLPVGLDPATMYLLSSLDGRRSLAEALEEVAAQGNVVPESLLPGALVGVRRLIELAFLVEARDGPAPSRSGAALS